MSDTEGSLVLANGQVFSGEIVGDLPEEGFVAGEVIFHTGMSGYQEIMTDPSYAGQLVTFTYPHIGNYGTTPEDNQSESARCSGVIAREFSRFPGSYRSKLPLRDFMRQEGLVGLGEVDTRSLAIAIRDTGSMPGAFGQTSVSELQAEANNPNLTTNHVYDVSTEQVYKVGQGDRRVVAFDFGIKRGIIQSLVARGVELVVVPAGTTVEEALEYEPDGVFLSNGPGDPSVLPEITANVKDLLSHDLPILGICLGHQLLATAIGGETMRLDYGHHGANHPVKDLATGKVIISSQNHNYAVADGTLDGVAKVSHVNLNDQTVEGLVVNDARAFSVQYHPEASPGPKEAAQVFDDFVAMVLKN